METDYKTFRAKENEKLYALSEKINEARQAYLDFLEYADEERRLDELHITLMREGSKVKFDVAEKDRFLANIICYEPVMNWMLKDIEAENTNKK